MEIAAELREPALKSAGPTGALRRALSALLLFGVLADASACIVAFARPAGEAEPASVSALCPCGCNAHTGALAGIGITQLAALPAEAVFPLISPRLSPEPEGANRIALAPVRAIDHVPILLV